MHEEAVRGGERGGGGVWADGDDVDGGGGLVEVWGPVAGLKEDGLEELLEVLVEEVSDAVVCEKREDERDGDAGRGEVGEEEL